MRKCWLYVILLFISIGSLQASHIVGGEFQLKAKRGYNYQLNLRMYFDELNASAGLINADLNINVTIFSKATNATMTTLSLKRDTDPHDVPFSNLICTDINSLDVKTLLMNYTADIFLDPAIYNDPAGYYVVWERCCRNAVINNIQSPDNTGTTFYLEFPPVVDLAGNHFINTSPVVQPMTNDFPCVNQPFTFSFGATDPDGDALVYTLVTPFRGWSGPNVNSNNDAEPPPSPAPYPLVIWKQGYGVANEIPGTPPLTVDASGVLHVTCNTKGLYAIALLIDEYRNGVKIGSVRREYQFKVIDCPIPYEGPIIGINKPGGGIFAKQDTLKLNVERDTCLTILISEKSDTTRNLIIKSIKTNIPSSIITIKKTFQAKKGDTLRTPMCFDACRKLNIDRDSLFYLEIVVQDEQCPTPKTDTLRLSVLYKPQVNAKPKVDLDTMSSPFTRHLLIGDILRFNVIGTDADPLDLLTLSGAGVGFSLSDFGMNFSKVVGSDSIVSPFSWQVPCKALDLGYFKLKFIVKDNSCIVANEDTISVILYVHDTVTNVEKFEPPNLITPNGDQKNDFFEFVNLPIDNCSSYFAGVFIYNRWGAKVFESLKRDFKWDPTVFSDGLYYYMVDFHSRKVKGWVQIVR